MTEVSDDGLINYTVSFDSDDIDAAFEELDARYIAGEAAGHAHTWSLIVQAYAGFNRRELPPTTPNLVSIDHRHGIASAQNDVIRYAHAAWDVTPDAKAYVETVHRLGDVGAVVTAPTYGTSQQGFHAEWRDVHLMTFEGDLGNRFELFDEADLDAALARFDGLSRPSHVLENAATRARARLVDAFNRRDLDGFLAVHDAGGRYEDRRRGLRNEGPVDPKFAHALLFEAPTSWHLEIEPVAVRGDRLALSRDKFRDTDAP